MNLGKEIGIPALLEQTAEECVELAHACLKLARIRRNDNPTPVTMEEAVNNLHEEMADVCLCMDTIANSGIVSFDAIDSIIMEKEKRWEERIKEATEDK
ncbi:MAG: hypothetical protein J6B01_04385 [Ruminococcus sp.]|nr:hypothetical protein [Ruminococcus sp.]